MEIKERLKYLISRKKELDNFKTINDIHKFHHFILRELIIEGEFIDSHSDMKYSYMWSQLENIRQEIEISIKLLRRNKENKAIDQFFEALRHLCQDYDYVIQMFKSKNNL